MVLIIIVTMVYKPTHNWGPQPCSYYGLATSQASGRHPIFGALWCPLVPLAPRRITGTAVESSVAWSRRKNRHQKRRGNHGCSRFFIWFVHVFLYGFSMFFFPVAFPCFFPMAFPWLFHGFSTAIPWFFFHKIMKS